MYLAPSDYGANTVFLTFTPTATRMCFRVNITNDDNSEDLEDFQARLSSTDSSVDVTPDTAVITIRDDDGNYSITGNEMSLSWNQSIEIHGV